MTIEPERLRELKNDAKCAIMVGDRGPFEEVLELITEVVELRGELRKATAGQVSTAVGRERLEIHRLHSVVKLKSEIHDFDMEELRKALNEVARLNKKDERASEAFACVAAIVHAYSEGLPDQWTVEDVTDGVTRLGQDLEQLRAKVGGLREDQ